MARRVPSVVPMSVGLLNEPPPQTPNSLAALSNPYTPRCAPDDSADSTPPDDVTTRASVASEPVCANAAGAVKTSMQRTDTQRTTSACADLARVFLSPTPESSSSRLLCAFAPLRETFSREGAKTARSRLRSDVIVAVEKLKLVTPLRRRCRTPLDMRACTRRSSSRTLRGLRPLRP